MPRRALFPLVNGMALLGFSISPLLGGEYAVLANGFRLKIDRHENIGSIVRLHTGQSFTELPTEAVREFESFVDPVPVAPAVNQPAPPAQTPNVRYVAHVAETNPKLLLRKAAADSGLPNALVESVARVESNFRSDAVSPKGALGIMQLMPETAKKLSADPTNPEQNTQAGARLLRELLIRYDGDVPKALAAYNAGAEAVDRYHGVPPYPETQNYVNQVIRNYIKAGGK